MSSWPIEEDAALNDYYGKHELGDNGLPTRGWLQVNLVSVALPYRMTPVWAPHEDVCRVWCHRLVAQSLLRVLEGIVKHYGSEHHIRSAKMHLYGGIYNYRRIAESRRLSLHAYGAAIDLDPESNSLGVPWRAGSGMMPETVIALFEAEGWKWGGRFHSRPDCMHFQATAW